MSAHVLAALAAEFGTSAQSYQQFKMRHYHQLNYNVWNTSKHSLFPAGKKRLEKVTTSKEMGQAIGSEEADGI